MLMPRSGEEFSLSASMNPTNACFADYPLIPIPEDCQRLCPATSSHQPQILVVEDHEDNLLLLLYALEALPCSLLTARDGRTALSHARLYHPHLILLDLLLPDINGFDIITQLRQIPEVCQTPIVAVTALARPEDQQRVFAAGGDGYLSKPYLLEDLEMLVRKYLKFPNLTA